MTVLLYIHRPVKSHIADVVYANPLLSSHLSKISVYIYNLLALPTFHSSASALVFESVR